MPKLLLTPANSAELPRPPRPAHHTDPVPAACLRLLLVLLLAMGGHTLPAQSPMRVEQTLLPWTSGDGAAGDGFGIALAEDGDWLAIGAYGKVLAAPGVLNGLAEGRVYLYQRQGGSWVASQELALPDPEGEVNFGAALALRGDALLVAAPRWPTGGQPEAGRVYLFRDDGLGQWSLEATLDAPAPQSDGRFGSSLVWLDEQRFAVGAPRENDRGAAGAGQVHVYQHGIGGWTFAQTLLPTTAEAEAAFGSALALSADSLLVGSPGAGAQDSGAVDRFGLPGLVSTLRTPSPLGPGAGFGQALAAGDAAVAVGAPLATVASEFGAGQVLYYPNGLDAAPLPALASAFPESQARFGAALALRAGRLWIGEPQADVAAAPDEGIVHVLPQLSGGTLGSAVMLNAPSPGLSGRLGTALAVEADGSLLAGADLDRVGPNGQGSVQRFAVDGAGFAAPERIDRGDGAYLERFGSAVAVAGEWAAAGSFLETTEAGAEAGAVYLYRQVDGSWERFQRLLSPDAATEQRYGIALALDGDRLLVGAYWDASQGEVDAGAAYVYRFDGTLWQLEQSLYPPTPELQGHFGFSVALDGTRLLVGSPGSDQGGFDEGAGFVYVFLAGQWQFEAFLQMPGQELTAEFGTRVALRGDLALLGAPSASTGGLASAGAVGAFRLGAGWTFEERLTAPAPAEGAGYGASLALGPDLIAIGAATDATADTAAGAIYLRSLQAGDELLLASDAQPGDRLGTSLAFTDGVLLAGAPGVDVAGRSSQGALYRWRRVDGRFVADPRLLIDDGQALDGFGLALAADGEWAFAAAPFHAGLAPQEGRVHAVAVGVLFADGFE